MPGNVLSRMSPQIDECDRRDEIEVLVVQRQPKGDPPSNACKNDLSNTFPTLFKKLAFVMLASQCPPNSIVPRVHEILRFCYSQLIAHEFESL